MPIEGLVDWQYLARINFLCRARTELQGLIEIELRGRARTVSRDLVRTELVDSLKVGPVAMAKRKSIIIRSVGILLTICIRTRPYGDVRKERVRYLHKHAHES